MSNSPSIRIAVLGCAAAAYAFFRVWRFHPACNPAYSRVAGTVAVDCKEAPSTWSDHLVWQDAIVIGALAALARWHAQASPWVPVLAFGMNLSFGIEPAAGVHAEMDILSVLGFLWPR